MAKAFKTVVSADNTKRVVVMYRADLGEYACTLFVNGKARLAATYYTDDSGDAVGTAQVMCGVNAVTSL